MVQCVQHQARPDCQHSTHRTTNNRTCGVVQHSVACPVPRLQVSSRIQQQRHKGLAVETHCHTKGADATLILGLRVGGVALVLCHTNMLVCGGLFGQRCG